MSRLSRCRSNKWVTFKISESKNNVLGIPIISLAFSAGLWFWAEIEFLVAFYLKYFFLPCWMVKLYYIESRSFIIRLSNPTNWVGKSFIIYARCIIFLSCRQKQFFSSVSSCSSHEVNFLGILPFTFFFYPLQLHFSKININSILIQFELNKSTIYKNKNPRVFRRVLLFVYSLRPLVS